MLRFIGWVALTFVGIFAALWLTIAITKPGPPGRIVMATGGASGAYHALALRYKAQLRNFGVDLELHPEIEGTASVNAVVASNDKLNIQAAFVKGGAAGSLQGRLASDAERKQHEGQVDMLRSMGRVFYEPLWVFYRGEPGVKSLHQFKGKRILIGSNTGGTRLVVSHLLQANGVNAQNSTLMSEDMEEDGKALREGKVDVAFLVLPPDSKKIQALLRAPGILLMNFAAEADAYTTRFPFLSKVVLSQGSVEFDPELPTADITLLTTSASIVVGRDLHPALANLLAYAIVREAKPGFDAEGDPILFHKTGRFPTAEDPEYKVNVEASIVYKSGEPPVLLRGLAPLSARWGMPFWVPAFAHVNGQQLLLLLIPLLSIILPLTRILPALYNWSMRRRLLRWYTSLKDLEASIENDPVTYEMRSAQRTEVERIEREVSRVKLPLGFSDQLYDLRLHIDLVRQRLGLRAVEAAEPVV